MLRRPLPNRHISAAITAVIEIMTQRMIKVAILIKHGIFGAIALNEYA